MNFNFELILFYLTAISGVIALIDVIFWSRKRKKSQAKMPMIIEYARSFFPIFLVVFLFRSFLYEPFRIPSGSLKPTLDIGDFIAVNKFDYGVRLPVIHKKIIQNNEPQRGDIIVFRWPPNPSVDFIKRVIGIPGDHISYIDKTLYVNGAKIPQRFLQNSIDQDEEGNKWLVVEKQEDFFGIKHSIFQKPNEVDEDIRDIVVPSGMYFTMGDNRDNSADSRFWGFVPEENIVGKAQLVWLSLDFKNYAIRFNRVGKVIH